MSDTSLNRIIQYGTTAARIAFTPNPPVGSQVLYFWYDTDNAPDIYIWDGSAWVLLNPVYVLPNTAVTPGVYGDGTNISQITIDAQGRITLAANVPVSPSAIVKIEEKTPSGVSTITFSSLGAYTHLKLLWNARCDHADYSAIPKIRFNGDTGNNYDYTGIVGTTTASAFQTLAATGADIGAIPGTVADANMADVGVLLIFDYRGTTFHKRGVINENYQRGITSGAQFTRQYSIGWRNTAAITSITIFLSAGNFIAGSKFSLYGIS